MKITDVLRTECINTLIMKIDGRVYRYQFKTTKPLTKEKENCNEIKTRQKTLFKLG